MADLLINNPNWQSFAGALEQDRGIAPGLLASIMGVETGGGHPNIINRTSSAGAQGAFQFMPATAKQYNVNVADTADSTRGAADYLGDLTKKYGNPLLAAAAYNWGPGSVDKAMAKAKAAGLPTDAISLANNGYLPKETSNYVNKVSQTLPTASQQTADSQPSAPTQPQTVQGPTPFAPEVVNATRSAVIDLTKSGASPSSIVQQLLNSPVSSMVGKMLDEGQLPAAIISQIGGSQLAELNAANSKVNAQGFGTNLVNGAVQAGKDMATGAGQLVDRVTGNDAALAQSQADQAKLEQDPTYQAQSKTAGGRIANFTVKGLPYIAGAMLTDGASIPASLVMQGAASEALTPTTGSGQIIPNIVSGAVTGAVTHGVVKGIGALVGAGANAAKTAVGNIDARTFMSPAARQEAIQAGMKDIQQQALEKVGLTGDAITPDSVATARNSIYTKPNEMLSNTVLPDNLHGIGPELDAAKAKYVDDTPKPEQSSNVSSYIDDIKNKIQNGGFTGAQLQAVRQGISDAAYNATAGSEKTALNNIVGAIDNHLAKVAPDAADALTTANNQWQHLQVLEKVVEKTKNQPEGLTPQNFINAVQDANKNVGQAETAPYQDLANAASKALTNVPASSLDSIVKSVHADPFSETNLLHAAVHPTTGVPLIAGKKIISSVLDKLAAPRAPTIGQFLTPSASASTPSAVSGATKAFITKALGNTPLPSPSSAAEAAVADASPAPILRLGYTPSAPIAAKPFYVSGDGTVGNNLLSVNHTTRVNSQIPDSVLASAALKNAPANAVETAPVNTKQAGDALLAEIRARKGQLDATPAPVTTKVMLPVNNKQAGEAILAEIRARNGQLGAKPATIVLPGDTPSPAFEIQHTTTELEDAAQRLMGKQKAPAKLDSEKDPAKVAQMKLVRLNGQLSRETSPSRVKILQSMIAAEEKKL
jgi:hypothetical protein